MLQNQLASPGREQDEEEAWTRAKDALECRPLNSLIASVPHLTVCCQQEHPASPGREQEEDEARARAEEALDYVEQLLEAYFMQACFPSYAISCILGIKSAHHPSPKMIDVNPFPCPI